MSTHRDAVLKSVHFDGPDYIPMTFGINRACWDWYKVDELKELMAEHRFLFPDFDPDFDPAKLEYGLNQRADRPYKDPWGCIWETAISGITGSVHGHPLESWDNFDVYEPPDPDSTDGTFPVDWDRSASSVRKNRENGSLVQMGLPHGHTFLRLLDIRGYQNLLFDMADGTDNVKRLIGMVSDFNLEIVGRALALEPDIMGYAEDLGMQVGPMISPDLFREYIKPVYKRLMEPARDRGVLVHMHSDGDIRTLAGDLIEDGVQVLNLQDLVNGVDWIAERFSGTICIDLDIDRQLTTYGGTPEQIDALIRDEVEKLGSRQGGLMMVYGLYPGVPLENVGALMDAMERYAGYYS